jgi:hypothetical protein
MSNNFFKASKDPLNLEKYFRIFLKYDCIRRRLMSREHIGNFTERLQLLPEQKLAFDSDVALLKNSER